MLAVVLVVVGGMVVGTALARYADTHVAAAPPSRRSALSTPAAGTSGSSTVSTSANQIDFSTRRGAGRLRLLDHDWARPPSSSGTARLRIRLELVCTEGAVDYAPEYFSLFDADGKLVEASRASGADALSFGRLGPGERVRGSVAFNVRRGDVTLVMGDDVSSVTALRLTD